jgi:hypothetical protein
MHPSRVASPPSSRRSSSRPLLRRRHLARGDAQQLGDALGIVELFGDQQVRLRSRERMPLGAGAQERATGIGGSDEALVVAHQRDDLAVEIHGVLADILRVVTSPAPRAWSRT